MQIRQLRYASGQWTDGADAPIPQADLQLVFAFGERAALADGRYLEGLHGKFPSARIVSCSSRGSITGATALDDGIVASAEAATTYELHNHTMTLTVISEGAEEIRS
jgi:hypothetical protein